jgi:hemerythrin
MASCGIKTTTNEQMELHGEDVEVQHRRLGQLVNELATSLVSEQRRSSGVRRALASLLNFSEIHFSDQEEFMKQYGYPRDLLDVHTGAHEEFLAKLRAVHDNNDSDLVALGPALVAWIRDWIEDHVFTEDHTYLEHFRKELR